MVLEKPLMRRVGADEQRVAGATAEVKCELLKLLVVTQFFPPDFAATGQLVEELVVQLGLQGVNVSVFTGQPGYAFAKQEAPEVEESGNVWVKRSRTTQLFSRRIRGKAVNGLLFAVRAMVHLVKRFRSYEILLVTTAPPFLPVVGYVANILFGLPYVCLLYDLYPDIAVELEVVSANNPIAKLWRWLNHQVWRRSAGIIVLSDSMKSRIVAHCPEVEKKISVIHSWADEQKIVPIPKAENWFVQKHGLGEHFVVLYSGNMGRCHDIDTLFETAKLLRDEPILFVCIGGGAKRDGLMERVTEAALENFRFLPYQEKAVLPYSLTAEDLSLVSVAEGMQDLVAPSKLYPAMATGRAIAAICPSASYLNTLLKDAKCGATFENGDAQGLAGYIRMLSQEEEQAQYLGKASRAYLESHFTPEIISRQYLKVISAAK